MLLLRGGAAVLRLLQLAERLARFHDSAHGWDPTTPAKPPTDVQSAVLGLLEKLPPFDTHSVRHEEMWPLLLWLLLKLIEPPPAQPLDGFDGSTADGGGGATTTPGRKVVGFAERCYTCIVDLVPRNAAGGPKT